MPMVNPDGAEAGTRRNAAGADLNRDHVTLVQPETQALHRVARRVRPHLAVDSHEFGRDSEEWTGAGLGEVARHHDGRAEQPALRRGAVAAARRWVDEAAAAEAKAGHRFLRYWVGGAPPDDEQRHSAPDIDGGLNGIGDVRRPLVHHRGRRPRTRAKDPPADLGNRVDAYLVLFRRFLDGGSRRAEDLAGVERARKLPAPGLPPDERPLGEPGRDGDGVPRRRGRDREGPEGPDREPDDRGRGEADGPDAARLRRRPDGGRGDSPRCSSGTASRSRRSRRRAPSRPRACTLLRVEEEFDDVYSRYGGRTIVKRGEARQAELPPGASGSRSRAKPPSGRRSSSSRPRCTASGSTRGFRALVGADGTIPVLPRRAPRGRERGGHASPRRSTPCPSSRADPADRAGRPPPRPAPVRPPVLDQLGDLDVQGGAPPARRGGRRHRAGASASPTPTRSTPPRRRPRPGTSSRSSSCRSSSRGSRSASSTRRFAHVRGNRMAKATRRERPRRPRRRRRRASRSTSSSAAPRKRIPSGISIGLQESPAALVAEVAEAVEKRLPPGQDEGEEGEGRRLRRGRARALPRPPADGRRERRLPPRGRRAPRRGSTPSA